MLCSLTVLGVPSSLISEITPPINHMYTLSKKNGYLLIEVLALPFLFSTHDKRLGH